MSDLYDYDYKNKSIDELVYLIIYFRHHLEGKESKRRIKELLLAVEGRKLTQ